jgi:hypothetical protein
MDFPSENNGNFTVDYFKRDGTLKSNVDTKLERKYGDENFLVLHEERRG